MVAINKSNQGADLRDIDNFKLEKFDSPEPRCRVKTEIGDNECTIAKNAIP